MIKIEDNKGNVVFEGSADEYHSRFPRRQPDPARRERPPTLPQMAAEFSKSMLHWSRSGFKTVDEEEFNRRLGICRSCEYWREDAMLGTHRCMKCGCSGLKLWLVTAKCKIDKWGPAKECPKADSNPLQPPCNP